MDFNLHPPLTAFPVALLSVAVILQIQNFFFKSKTLESLIEVNLLIATIAAIAAFFSGYEAAEHASATFQVSTDLIAWHHSVGRMLLFAIIPCFFLCYFSRRAKFNRKLFLSGYYLLLFISIILVVYTGYLGGELVFSHGAGVKASVTK